MTQLTGRQREVLNFILDCIRRIGLPPTRAEIREHFGWASPTSAQQVVEAIARKGYLTILPGKAARGIVVHRHAGKAVAADRRFKEGSA